uniref:Uncharacterized protein n=1 Tax=Hyaloperonospora arabidopsidis (strain Emoy2) TaxID=559515 RepID=M4BUR3_HYAAE
MKAYPRTVDYLSKLAHTRDVEQERVDQEEVEQGDVDQEQVDQEEEEQEDVDQYEDEKEQEQEQVMHRDVSGSTKTLSMIQASDIAEKWGRTTGNSALASWTEMWHCDWLC